MSEFEKVWVGLRIVLPGDADPRTYDRLAFLRRSFPNFHNFRFTTGCGRRVIYALDDIPPTDVRCICGEEFFVQWVQPHESKHG